MRGGAAGFVENDARTRGLRDLVLGAREIPIKQVDYGVLAGGSASLTSIVLSCARGSVAPANM